MDHNSVRKYHSPLFGKNLLKPTELTGYDQSAVKIDVIFVFEILKHNKRQNNITSVKNTVTEWCCISF